MFPPDPDPYWRALEILVIGGALLAILVAAILLAYGFLRDWYDRSDVQPDRSAILDRLNPHRHKAKRHT